MKPVAIFRHSPTEGPGYFATFLDAHRIPWTLVRVDSGDPVPVDPRAFSALCFMGGPMSVNDGLAWIPGVLAIIREAVRIGVPTIGHCLGGQLIAKALGGSVSRNPVKEIGWGMVSVEDNASAREWLGEPRAFEAFHWHGETFTLPEGAVPLLRSAYCANQAFALGPHLAMQCHVEMTPELIRAWCEDWGSEARDMAGPSIQSPGRMQEDLEAKVRRLNAIADRLYKRWVLGLRSDER